MTALATPPSPLMSVDEFLAWPGDGIGTIFDLVDGRIRAQEVPSDACGTIHSNVASTVANHLRNKSLRSRAIIHGGIRPNLRADWNYRIPDIVVTCTPNEQGMRDVPNPKLIIELLSPTNKTDTWDNVRNYVTLPSVEEIVLIETTRAEASILRRSAEGQWPKNPLDIDRAGPIPLASIALEITMADVYWGTHVAGRIG